MNVQQSSILLVLPVPFMKDEKGQIYFEKQACNGLRLWRQNFDRVVVAAPLKPGKPPQDEWIPLPVMAGVEEILLPYAYHPATFIRTLRATRHVLRNLIGQARYLQFAIGGLIGDWASIACLEAIRCKRDYSVWTDNVGSGILWIEAKLAHSAKSRVKSAIAFLPTKLYERYVIKHSVLGLFHGHECFAAFAKFCPIPQLVHDIHLGPEMVIGEGELREKAKQVNQRPLRICYAGRVEPEKGAKDWLQVLRLVNDAGCNFTAVWIGSGSLLEEMRAATRNAGLDQCVEFSGRVDHRQAISMIKEADFMLFCHKLPESPRCLIESLMNGTPIVGYDSHFPRDLIAAHGGGKLTKADAIDKLAGAVVDICRDREHLSQMIVAAQKDGSKFSDIAVFRHRSDLIKSYL